MRENPLLKIARRYLACIYADAVRKRLLAQIEQVRAENAGVFLDLGCHVGYNTARVRDVLRPNQTIGIEFNFFSIQEARARGINVIQQDLNDSISLRGESVDVVTAYDILEHLTETWQVLSEIHRILKPNGFVLIDCPNLASWHNVFNLFLGFQPSSGPHLISMADSDLKLIEDMHRQDHNLLAKKAEELSKSKMHRHIVVPAFKSLLRVLVKVGFDIEDAWGFGYYPLPPIIADWVCKIDISHAHHYLIKARKLAPDHTL